MGFFNRKTSKQTSRVKKLLKLALSRLTIARRPRLARKSISLSDVGQLLILGHLDRAIQRVRTMNFSRHTWNAMPYSSNAGTLTPTLFLQAEQFIEEDNMLLALDIIELYCKSLIEHAAKLDKPQESGEEIKDAVAGIMFAARWCSDLPELLLARDILAHKFSSDFAANAKEGTGIVDPMLVWKLSGDKTNMELKKKVTKEIATENNIWVDFSVLQEAVKSNDNGNATGFVMNEDRRS
ncbi:hypothetical protein HU200_011898 [Digitaria exilis]|uniref:Uncharacterized protein n=1 Tax=Digitaria exilis TaxID=1010633 RepID=A0A835KMA9_9POAL|nr:hypothetical protein HU200_011898 [Digitaria exilis]